MMQFLRETWDIFGVTLLAMIAICMLLWWAGAISLATVPVMAAVGTIVLVFCGLWMLALAGGTIPW